MATKHVIIKLTLVTMSICDDSARILSSNRQIPVFVLGYLPENISHSLEFTSFIIKNNFVY